MLGGTLPLAREAGMRVELPVREAPFLLQGAEQVDTSLRLRHLQIACHDHSRAQTRSSHTRRPKLKPKLKRTRNRWDQLGASQCTQQLLPVWVTWQVGQIRPKAVEEAGHLFRQQGIEGP